MISVRNLTRKYGAFTAVNSVSFDIERGQIVGLLGHNGAGKTTTLQMLTGFLEPTEGSVHIDGVDLAEDLLSVQKKIGYLSEQSPLYPEMTIQEYLHYVAQMRGISEENAASAVKEAIRATDLGVKAKNLISTLSRGYKQRVGVAQAIIDKPEILILDEPTNGLDPTQIIAMRSLIKNLAKTSTVIVSTHILQEVEAICDRAIIILNGRIAVDAHLNELQRNDRMSLSLKQDLTEVKSLFASMEGVQEVSVLGEKNGVHEYSLAIEGNVGTLAPQIAKKVIDQQWDLYGMHSDQRDLETVFNEVNGATTGGSHV